MMSKPATHIVTAANSRMAGSVIRPAMPMYAPSGASPSTAPSTKWPTHVKRLQSGYTSNSTTAIGISLTHSGLSFSAAQSSTCEAGGGRPKHRRRGERAARDRAARRARIARVDLAIEKAVRRHRRGARADDGERDPPQRGQRRNPARGQYRADVRERQREKRVLDADLPQKDREEPHASFRRGHAEPA